MEIRKCARCVEKKYIESNGMCGTCLSSIEIGDRVKFRVDWRVDFVFDVNDIDDGDAHIIDPDGDGGWMSLGELRPLSVEEEIRDNQGDQL